MAIHVTTRLKAQMPRRMAFPLPFSSEAKLMRNSAVWQQMWALGERLRRSS